ncbi:MAG: glycosyltransferase [Pseudolabrys sp.]
MIQNFALISGFFAAACVAIWLYLLAGRGQFWRGPVRDVAHLPAWPADWPSVAVIIPARNEAAFIGSSVQSLVRQDYRGSLTIIVVDDNSNDDTAKVVLQASETNRGRPVTAIRGSSPPVGWTGKLWALSQGIAASEQAAPDYILLTDADIVHAHDTVSSLVARSISGGYALTSLMAKLRCSSFAERSHVPAFVYFFQMVFPFNWVASPQSRTAAAAGGCMLVRADLLRRIGGIACIRNALIDDCSLAARLKAMGPIWLGLTDRISSIRPYETLADVAQMISRSAYAQLRYSPLLLLLVVIGMTFTFFAPPFLAIFAEGLPRYLGMVAWLAMALSFVPMLRFYRLSPLWSVALPGIALFYLIHTMVSAYRHLRGRGGMWKERVHLKEPNLQ